MLGYGLFMLFNAVWMSPATGSMQAVWGGADPGMVAVAVLMAGSGLIMLGGEARLVASLTSRNRFEKRRVLETPPCFK